MQPLAFIAVTLAAVSLGYRLAVKARDEYRWRQAQARCAQVRRARIEASA